MNPNTDLETRLHDEIRSSEPAFTMTVAPSFVVARRVRRRRTMAAISGGSLVAAAVLISSNLTLGGASTNGDVAQDGSVTSASSQTSSADAAASERDQRLLLDAPGWRLDAPGSDGDVFRKGQAFLEVTRYPAGSYESYVADREHIYDPPAAGAPVQVLGRNAQMWAYSADDHAAIREVVDGQWMEFRGQGMDQAAYLALLGRLRAVSLEDFEAAMPAEFVAAVERSAAIDEILAGITATVGPARDAFPMGHAPVLKSAEADPYQLGAYVVGQVTCAWIAQYADALSSGDAATAADAAEVLATSRRWPVLLNMDQDGDYPQVVWDYSDEVNAGRVPEGYRGGLGC